MSWSDLFDQYDTDGGGTLGPEEFLQAVRYDGRIKEDQISDQQVEQLFNHVDKDGSGEIDYEEFASKMTKMLGDEGDANMFDWSVLALTLFECFNVVLIKT